MKSNSIIVLLATIFVIYSFTKNDKEQINENTFLEIQDIGAVKQSVLKPLAFNKSQTGTWGLLKGQELNQNSELFKVLEENSELNILTKKEEKYFLPNALGVFIRSSNYNGEGVDPNTNRLVGSFQDHLIAQHRHSFNSNGGGGGYGNVIDGQRSSTININTSYYGGAETRPKNISLYTYIKISN